MFAYVRYLFDGVLDIIPITKIQNFCPKNITDYDKTSIYMSYWEAGIAQNKKKNPIKANSVSTADNCENEDGFYASQILLLADSKSEIENILKSGKRISIPKVRDLYHASGRSDGSSIVPNRESAKIAEEEEANEEHAEKIRKSADGKIYNLKKCIEEHKMSRRRNPLFSHKRKIVQEILSSDSEDPAMVPQKEKDNVLKELRKYESKYHMVKDEKSKLSAKILKLEKELLTEKKENDKLRDLNFQLQNVVIKRFDDYFGNVFDRNYANQKSSGIMCCSSSPSEDFPSVHPIEKDCAQVAEESQSRMHLKKASTASNTSESYNDKVDLPKTSTTIEIFRESHQQIMDGSAHSGSAMEEMIDIGDGVLVNATKYGIATANEKPSMWAKEVAVCIWGSVVLGTRSVDGKPCNRLLASGAKAMPPLTPLKLNVFKCKYAEFLKKKYPVDSEDYKKQDRKFKKYIGEKISDIKKRIKKESQANENPPVGVNGNVLCNAPSI